MLRVLNPVDVLSCTWPSTSMAPRRSEAIAITATQYTVSFDACFHQPFVNISEELVCVRYFLCPR